ncbi:hypothetical protein IL992_27090 [Microbispora sp. NEAU-D428]|uniref:hypothetical protein n=1 Tax=Microbispora sitophila TaxID=2771537 RepID=UPI0018685A68|nr:hypothetical protein [Microbispora sitophila]MBE3012823.1 hypothetical protein [Microbispora sitophila]
MSHYQTPDDINQPHNDDISLPSTTETGAVPAAQPEPPGQQCKCNFADSTCIAFNGTGHKNDPITAEPVIDPAPCNALSCTPTGLLVPTVLLEAGQGLQVTAPQQGACPQTWRIELSGTWSQTPATLAFRHDLTEAAREWEAVSEVPTLTIPRSGEWEVNFQVRGAVTIPPNPGPAQQATGVTAAIYKNGVLVNGTELMVVHISEPGNGPGNHVQATGSRQFMHRFDAGDTIELVARRTTTNGSAAVVSNIDGRTYVTAHWLAPHDVTP